MDSLVQQFRALGSARLAALAGVAIGFLGFVVYVVSRISTPAFDLLYGDLAPQDSKAILKELDARKIPYELRNNGSEILVPAPQVQKLRVEMAEIALPLSASVGYEIFDKMDGLSSTNFMQNVNMLRALEGELARTITAIDGVKSARVHLVLPKREVFTRDTQDPSATVYIRMERGRMDKQQVVAVQNLVATAVPKLKPSAISIIDERGNLLSAGTAPDGISTLSSQEELRRNEEVRLARSIELLLENVLGVGKVRAEVRADIDFDKVVTNQEIFDPESRVPRSSVTREENNQSTENDPGAVTVANNLPNAQVQSGGPAAQSREQRTEETTNYEISKKIVNQIKEGPVIRRLSIAVLVDGSYAADAAGNKTYQPRPAAELDQIAALARSAIGFDAQRGDQIEIINMQFQGIEDASPTPPWQFLGFSKDEIIRIAEGLGVAIIALLVILLVVRPLMARIFEGAVASTEAMLAEGAGAPQLTGPASGVPAPIPEEEDLSEELIDIDKVEGRVKASSLRKIGEIVDKHPEEAVAIIRNWMIQES